MTPGPLRSAGDGTVWSVNPDSDDHLGPDPHEAWLEPILRGLLRQGSTFLDVGAHVGRWTIRAALWGVQVIAWEPAEDTMRRLQLNLQLNAVEHRVTTQQLAAWNKDDPHLQLRPMHAHMRDGSASLVSQEEGEAEPVAGRRLDSLLTVEGIEVVKLDVEGADAEALEGMMDLLVLRRPTVIWENHAWLYPHKRINDRASNVLAAADYQSTELRVDRHADGTPIPYMLLTPSDPPVATRERRQSGSLAP